MYFDTNKQISSLGFLQFEIIQGDIWKNFQQVKDELARLAPPAGTIFALPEMWACGFVYEQLDSLTDDIPALLQEVNALAAFHNIILAGSLPEKKQINGKSVLHNTLFFSGLDGADTPGIAKQHLFSFWKEDRWFVHGGQPDVIPCGDEQLGGLVCYDLRFPEAARGQCRQGAGILLMSAQWPAARIEQWKILLQARAIENQTFVLAANACGSWDGLMMGGHSMLIAPDGEILKEAGGSVESAVVPLNTEVQKELRERFNTAAPDSWNHDDGDKLQSLAGLTRIVHQRKSAGQTIVFTNGCFDILHAGHVEYLQKARQQGDFLILGLNNDESIRSIKGPDRPVNEENRRARVVAALGCVDAVVLFGEDTPLSLITTLVPDVLVKGADWAEDEIAGAAEVKAAGGRVERIPFTSRTSTTAMIERIRS